MSWIKKGKALIIKAAPPPVVKFSKNYPRAFKAIVVLAVLIPMGVTVLIALSALLWPFYLR